MKNPHPTKVGDTVVLNDHGLGVCFSSSRGLSHMKTKHMRITYIDRLSMTEPEKTYIVEVDDPEINELLITHNCFDVVGAHQ